MFTISFKILSITVQKPIVAGREVVVIELYMCGVISGTEQILSLKENQ